MRGRGGLRRTGAGLGSLEFKGLGLAGLGGEGVKGLGLRAQAARYSLQPGLIFTAMLSEVGNKIHTCPQSVHIQA